AIALYRDLIREQPVPPRRDLLAGATLCNLAYLAARAGDKERAQQLYDALLPQAGSFVNTTVAKPITEHFLGLLAATVCDEVRAEGHYAVAVAAHEKAGAPLLAAESRIEWARLLLASGADPGRAALLTDAVTETATNYAAPFLQGEVHDLRGNRPTTSPSPPPPPRRGRRSRP
ncbi:MAG: hypothetical protein ACXVQ7_12480, partial [Actinomycetota bacterium]